MGKSNKVTHNVHAKGKHHPFIMASENPSDPHRIVPDKHERPHVLLEVADSLDSRYTPDARRQDHQKLLGTLTRHLTRRAMRILAQTPRDQNVPDAP